MDEIETRIPANVHIAETILDFRGAVVIASVTSCISWQVISTSHWSASALFYSSIILAFVAIVAAAQQGMVLPGDETLMATTNLPSISGMVTSGNELTHWQLVFVLQCPLMFFSFAVATFLAGLFAVVFGPLGRTLSGTTLRRYAEDSSFLKRVVIDISFAGADCYFLWGGQYRCHRRIRC